MGEGECTQLAGGFTLTAKRLSHSPVVSGDAMLVIRNPDLGRLRLDQVLARGLKLNRKDVLKLAETGALGVPGSPLKALRRPVPDTLKIVFHVPGETCATKLRDRLMDWQGPRDV